MRSVPGAAVADDAWNGDSALVISITTKEKGRLAAPLCCSSARMLRQSMTA
jgi:hypothetical protein